MDEINGNGYARSGEGWTWGEITLRMTVHEDGTVERHPLEYHEPVEFDDDDETAPPIYITLVTPPT